MAFQTWEQVQARPDYQQLDDAGKAATRANWEKAAASKGVAAQPSQPKQTQPAPTAPEQSPSMLDDIGSSVGRFAQGAVAGVGRGLGHGVGGTVEAIENTLGTGTTYGKRMVENTDQQYKRDLDASGQAGSYGAKVGGIAADVGSMVAAPEVAIPAIAAREFGSAYANQKDDQKNLLTAGLVGGANYYAGKIIPGGMGEAAEGLVRGGVNNALRTIGSNAVAGAKGGTLVGGAQALAEDNDADVGDVVGGAFKGAATGAAFGGAIGGVHAGIKGVRGTTSEPTTTPENRILPETSNPDTAARQAQVVRGSNILADHGIPLRTARLGDDPAAQAAFGKTQEDVIASRNSDAKSVTNQNFPILPERFGGTGSEEAGKMNVTNSQIEKGAKRLTTDMNQSLADANKHIDDTNQSVREGINEDSISPTQRSAIRSELATYDTFKKDFANYKTAMDNVAGRKEAGGEEGSIPRDALIARAQKVQDSYNALPDYLRSDFDANFKGVKGFEDGFQPVSHAEDFHEAISQLTNQHPNWRGTTDASKSTETAVSITNPIKAISSIWKASRAPAARKANIAEQADALAATRSLAQGSARTEQSRSTVDQSRESMQNPVVDDGTQGKMEYSTDTPVEAPVTPAPAPQPDSVMTRAPRQPVAPESVVEAPVEPAPTQSSPDDLAQLSANVERMRQQRNAPVEETAPAQEPAPEPEPIPVDTTFNREQARQVFKRSTGREPTPEEVAEAEAAQRAAITEQAQARMEDVSRFAREAQRPAPTSPEPEPIPVDTAPEPIAEVAPRPEPDQGIVREPTKPAEPEPIEPPQETPPEPAVEPKAEPEQGIVRKPKASEKPAEAEPEPAPLYEPKTAPLEDAKVADKVRFNSDVRAAKAIRDQFSTPEVKDQITVESVRKGLDMDRLRHEDAMGNVEGIRTHVRRVLERRDARQKQTHTENVNSLDAWAKDNNIDPKFVAQAMKNKDLVLTTSGIKAQARRLQEMDNARNNPDKISDSDLVSAISQQKEALSRVSKMTSPAATELQAQVAEKFGPLVKADNTPLTPSQFQKFIVKLHKEEAAINRRENLKAEAEVADKKAADAAKENAANAPTVAKQRDALLSELEGMSPEARKDVEPLIVREFHARDKAGQVMTPTELSTFKGRMYRSEFDANEKAGKMKDAAEAQTKIDAEVKAKEAATKAEETQKRLSAEQEAANKKVVAQRQLEDQQAKVEDRIRQELKAKEGISDREIEDVVGAYMHNKAFESLKEPMSAIQERKAFQDATSFGKDHVKLMDSANDAAKEANLTSENHKEVIEALKEMETKINDVTERLKASDKGTKEEVKAQAQAAENALVSEAEKVFSNKDAKIDELVAAAKTLKDVYFNGDAQRAHSVTRFAEVLSDVLAAQKKYPNQEALWLTHDDVRSLAKTGFKDAGGLMDKLVRNVLGMKYGESNLLTNAQRDALASRMEAGERLDVNLMSKKGRAALLQGGEGSPAKQKVTIKRRNKAGVYNR